MSESADRRRYLLWRSLGSLLEQLPVGVAVRIAELAGWLASFVATDARATATRNLRRITEQGSDTPIDERVLERWVRRSFASYGRYWAEGATLPGVSGRTVVEHMEITQGIEHLHGRGRGDLFVHLVIDVPTELDDASEELLRQFATLRNEPVREHAGGVFRRRRAKK